MRPKPNTEKGAKPLGKRFGRLKTDLGVDRRYVCHSIRKTVAHMFETAECPVGVAKDVIGDAKSDLTFGLYSGETRMDIGRDGWRKAIRYPSVTDDHHPEPDQTENPEAVLEPPGLLPSG